MYIITIIITNYIQVWNNIFFFFFTENVKCIYRRLEYNKTKPVYERLSLF